MDRYTQRHEGSSIDIPCYSFTAFKLRYGTANGLNRTTTIISLGSVPRSWLLYKQSALLSTLHNIGKRSDGSLTKSTEMFDNVARNFGFRSSRQDSGRSSSGISNVLSEETQVLENSRSMSSDSITTHDRPEGSLTDLTRQLRPKNKNDHSARGDDERNSGSLFGKPRTRKPSNYKDLTKTLGWSNDDFLVFNEKLSSRSNMENDEAKNDKQDLYSHNHLYHDIAKARIMGKEVRNAEGVSSNASFVTANEFSDSTSPVIQPQDSGSQNVSDETILGSSDTLMVSQRQSGREPPVALPMVKSVTFSSSTKKTRSSKKKKTIEVELLDPKEHVGVSDIDDQQQSHSHFRDFYEQVNDEMIAIFDKLRHKTVGARYRINSEYSKIEQRRKLKRMFQEFSAGNIVKMEKMLVTVIMKETKYEAEGSSRLVEKWKEYIVVARSTGNHEYPIVLQFFKKRNIRFVDLEGITQFDDDDSVFDDVYLNKSAKSLPSHLEFDLLLSISDTRIRFRNVLDKTISISKITRKHRDFEYILLPQTQSSAIRWLSLLNTVLKSRSREEQKTLLLKIPDIDLSLTIKNLSSYLRAEDYCIKEDDFRIEMLEKGYSIPRSNAFNKLVDIIAAQLLILNDKGCLPPKGNVFINSLPYRKHLLAFATKKYDRLEWMLGESEKLLQATWLLLNNTHDIELRELKHEPLMLMNEPMVEPRPVEGFLVCLSNRGGKLKSSFGRNYYKLRYFSSFDNILMFQDFHTAVPPFEDSMTDIMSPLGKVLDEKELAEKVHSRGLHFEKSPFPLDPSNPSHIGWLRPGISKEEFEKRDMDALYEAERRASTIVNCKGIIDLCNVSEIRCTPTSDVSNVIRLAGSLAWGYQQSRLDDENYVDSVFELILKSGCKIRLQACNRRIRDQWVFNLLQLREYWVKKKQEELERIINLREKNIIAANLPDDKYESVLTVDDNPNKWELSKAHTDPYLYNISSWSIDKPLMMSGVLYQKRKKHKSFKAFFVVLCPGFLVLYDMFNRGFKSGTIKPTAYYKHYTTISLGNCYVFCDSSNDLDVSIRDSTLSRVAPGSHQVPRIYSDGWKSSEDEHCRRFTIWFGSKRVMMRNNNSKNVILNDPHLDSSSDEDEETVDKTDKISLHDRGKMLKTVSRLGVTGHSMVFLARSRIERDLWVTKLLNEVERFGLGDEEEVQFS
ncbi:hypothetical protein KL906_001870 [Ogataea polymorpha]|uniref:PH domain-containing protein n=1 Tax=Ogataea polymorpha TaxID=460523 RepID=A0A9P8T0R3_9ASCO|nr:hypothetical protein KL906_001870 [Ogataea polymorpha]KAG7917665.1 hypothetical protein KL927_002408 [Ogataea polymorpha]KAH3660876.1 hypothetical protein OGATHE_005208 [Ogataea polymorpha]